MEMRRVAVAMVTQKNRVKLLLNINCCGAYVVG
jgi:hypothetical protein